MRARTDSCEAARIADADSHLDQPEIDGGQTVSSSSESVTFTISCNTAITLSALLLPSSILIACAEPLPFFSLRSSSAQLRSLHKTDRKSRISAPFRLVRSRS